MRNTRNDQWPIYKYAESDELESFYAQHVAPHLTRYRPQYRRCVENAYRLLTANLFIVEGLSARLIVPCRNESWGFAATGCALEFNARHVGELLKILSSGDFIDMSHPVPRQIATTARASGELKALLTSHTPRISKDRSSYICLRGSPPEKTRRRGGKKAKVPFIKFLMTEELLAKEAELKRLHRAIEGLDIVLDIDIAEDDPHRERKLEFLMDKKRQLAEYRKPYRVFNDGSFQLGGRIYGFGFQGIPESWRAQLLIQGERVVELDYSAFHPRMTYHYAQIDPPEDPYDFLPPRFRDIAKIVLNTLLNGGGQGAIYAFLAELMDLDRQDIWAAPEDIVAKAKLAREVLAYWKPQDLVAICKRAHWPIAHHMEDKLIGKELQFEDSEMMIKMLMRLLDQGVVALPIHDSLVVKASDRDAAFRAMEDVYVERWNRKPIIKCKSDRHQRPSKCR